MGLRPAVFVDKDGTLVENVPFNVDPARVRLADGAGEALGLLRRSGFALVLVSNQPGIALGRFPASALASIDARLQELLAPHGARLDATFYCPHAPDTVNGISAPGCGCRKPAPGLILRAASELALDLPASWMIGDILDDVEAGASAGCRTVLVDNGGETEWRRSPARTPDFIVSDPMAAARIICTAAPPKPGAYAARAAGPGGSR